MRDRNRIKRYTPHWFFKWFRVYFPDLKGQDCMDTDLLLATMQARMNPIKLDDALIERHGEFEGSTKDFVTRKYGKMAALFVEVAIGSQPEGEA